jgi:HAD superfamily hydrolase (TIGR01509 family)
MIKNIIFDLDGVLFDGRGFHAATFLEAVRIVIPYTSLTEEYHEKYLDSLSTKQKLLHLKYDDDICKRIYHMKQAITAKNIKDHIRPNNMVKDICERLISLGYELFCVSNSIRSTVEVCLEGMGVIQYFKGIISNEDTVEPKPSPEPYLTLYRKYNLDPKECLIVEDSPHGIESATKSGGNVLPVKDCSQVTMERIINALSKIHHTL